MTTRGKSGLKRAIMGSVADVVIRESGKPVLVIRPQTSSKK
jgi:nucleotide-binding universal stress UspA family protein